MALKGRNWFFGKCLLEERKRTKFTYLSAKALDLGFGREHTQGHILQSCGATQMFLNEFPQHKRIIRRASPTEPFRIRGNILRDWRVFFSLKQDDYGRATFGYNWSNLKSYLTNRYGGNCRGGGGGDNELEIVLRLMAEFT
ncbi:MAG TPA: hypothetical protein ACFYEK_13790 [Candidatus Wunengus sp. YC60]|uniref:hypothetical protein n=1 Tax=Candidatus Wunengus sp. YC60 TaxID=3367697 RepID=UPI0040296375